MVLKPTNAKTLWNGNRKAGKPQRRTSAGFNTSVIVHTTENPVGAPAKNVADWQNRQQKRYSGYHFLVDCDGFYLFANPKTTRTYHGGKSIVQPGRTAGASNDIGMALVAYARKWKKADPKKLDKLMEQASRCAAYLHLTYHIPLEHIRRAAYKEGQDGFIGHQEVATPRGRKSDPGMRTGFDWDMFLDRARVFADVHRAPPPSAVVEPPVVVVGPSKWPLTKDNAADLNALADNILKIKGNPRSLVYTLRFYRHIAEKAGISGAKPEEVAEWLLTKVAGPPGPKT